MKALKIGVLFATLLTFYTSAFANKTCKLCNTTNGCTETIFDGYQTCSFDEVDHVCTLTGDCVGQGLANNNCSSPTAASGAIVDYAKDHPWTRSPDLVAQINPLDPLLATAIRHIQASVAKDPRGPAGYTIKIATPQGDAIATYDVNTYILTIHEPQVDGHELFRSLHLRNGVWTLTSSDGLNTSGKYEEPVQSDNKSK